LIFESEIEFPEMLKTNGEPDVYVRVRKVPENLKSFSYFSQFYQVDKNRFLLSLDGVGRFLVQNGNEILVQPYPDSTESEIRLFILGTCLGVLLHQRGILPLHASAIVTNHGAVLFTGPSGVGKSTLLAAFLQRDYLMLADDVSGIILDRQNLPVVLPAIPRTKLWADTIKHLGYDLDTLPRLRPVEEKYGLSIQERFFHKPITLHRIYSLNINKHNRIYIEQLDRLNGFQVVLNNTYRELFIDGLERRSSHFELATTTARYAIIKSISYPINFHQLNNLVKLIEADFSINK
jgi:hypothetical protein